MPKKAKIIEESVEEPQQEEAKEPEKAEKEPEKIEKEPEKIEKEPEKNDKDEKAEKDDKEPEEKEAPPPPPPPLERQENPAKKPGRPPKENAINFKEKVTCPKCERTFARANMKRHEQVCRGAPWKREPPKKRESIQEVVKQSVKEAVQFAKIPQEPEVRVREMTEAEKIQWLRQFVGAKDRRREAKFAALFK